MLAAFLLLLLFNYSTHARRIALCLQRSSGRQRWQRPPRLREWQQGAEEVAGAEAEAAEVAGGGSKGQRKSPKQRQRPPMLKKGATRGKNVAGAEAEAAEKKMSKNNSE